MKNLFLILATAFLTVACEMETSVEADSDGENNRNNRSIRESVLAGEINGRGWSFISGRAKPSSFNEDAYSFAFWDEDVLDPCDQFSMGSEAQLLGFFPLSKGAHSLGNTHNINFNYGSQNNIATDGRIVITEIIGDKVYGKLIATFDETNYVNGTFELTLCK